ncbi:DUF2975 domain-containing protein [Arundinibacter roseus]|uniref:DUF2975 domain-containing protein n=1 Tax=Arundinibacter roseus TaxID=2070510 RepID=A0A4R4KPL8_9BACT|nr:DUF2975 domain-containing protein [Arundinibacter roseus]TDB68856.1 DUF2975 domain-containing protein [Arundinibacter roseus]
MKTEHILFGLRIVAWAVFLGAIVRTALMIGYIIAIFVFPDNPIKNNAQPSDLAAFQQTHEVEFWMLMSLIIAIALLHIQLWEKIKDALETIKISNPFTVQMATLFEKTAYLLISIWVVSFIGSIYFRQVSKRTEGLEQIIDRISVGMVDGGGFDAGGVYLLNAGIVYIISQIFRRGIEMQQENDLTI